MIKHIEHSVGTVELAKKLNEVIRIVNDSNPINRPELEPKLLYDLIQTYGLHRSNSGYYSREQEHAESGKCIDSANRVLAQIRGMLGIK